MMDSLFDKLPIIKCLDCRGYGGNNIKITIPCYICNVSSSTCMKCTNQKILDITMWKKCNFCLGSGHILVARL